MMVLEMAKNPNFLNAYDRSDDVCVDYTNVESVTEQQFKNSSDINFLIDSKGVIMDSAFLQMSNRSPIFSDFTRVGSYHEHCNKLNDAADWFFNNLTSKQREFFKNDPSVFYDFMVSPDDQTLKDLGLFDLLNLKKDDITTVDKNTVQKSSNKFEDLADSSTVVDQGDKKA